MCHEDRDGVFELLERLGARPVDVATELTDLVPRLQGRPAARPLTAAPTAWDLSRPAAATSATTSRRLREVEQRRHGGQLEPVGRGHRVRPGSRPRPAGAAMGVPDLVHDSASRLPSTANSPRRSVRKAASEPGRPRLDRPDRSIAAVEARASARARRSAPSGTRPSRPRVSADIRARKYGRWNAEPRAFDREPARGVETEEPDAAPSADGARRSGR